MIPGLSKSLRQLYDEVFYGEDRVPTTHPCYRPLDDARGLLEEVRLVAHDVNLLPTRGEDETKALSAAVIALVNLQNALSHYVTLRESHK